MTRNLAGDLVALDFYYGDGHHLVIDVSFSSVWRNATIRQCASIPSGYAAAQREHDDSSRLIEHLASLSLGSDVTPLIPVDVMIEDGGRTGNQADTWLWHQLAGRELTLIVGTLDRKSPGWHTPAPSAVVASATVRRWEVGTAHLRLAAHRQMLHPYASPYQIISY